MTLNNIRYCPCTLSEGYNTYSPTGLRLLYNRKKVSHVLEFNAQEQMKQLPKNCDKTVRPFPSAAHSLNNL